MGDTRKFAEVRQRPARWWLDKRGTASRWTGRLSPLITSLLWAPGPVKGLGQCFTPTPWRDLTSSRGLRRSDLQRLIRLCRRLINYIKQFCKHAEYDTGTVVILKPWQNMQL